MAHHNLACGGFGLVSSTVVLNRNHWQLQQQNSDFLLLESPRGHECTYTAYKMQ